MKYKMKGSPYKMGTIEGTSAFRKENEKTVAGQYLESIGDNKYKDVDSGKVYTDTAGVVTMGKGKNVTDNDYIIKDGKIIGEK